MKKLTTAAFALALAAALGAQTTPKPSAPPAGQVPAATTAPQTPPRPATPPAAQTPPAAAPAPRPAGQGTSRATATLFVTNPAGAPIPDVRITLSGTVDRELVTTRDAATRIPNLRSGTYRARFDAPDYVLFEKELVLRPGQSWEFEVTLNPAPVKKAEAPPAPPPSPAPARQPAPPPETAGEVSMLSLSDWLDEFLIGRNEPQRDSVIGKTQGATASVFQVRENVADRVHADADAILYVIAGEATLRVGGRAQAVAASWFVSIPRGTPYSIERRGRNPLIMLSVTAPAGGTPAEPR